MDKEMGLGVSHLRLTSLSCFFFYVSLNKFNFLSRLGRYPLKAFFFVFFFLKKMPLVAPVSEFNCFLRSRCSVEMWCPDDIGRDSRDWVGPLAWGRA